MEPIKQRSILADFEFTIEHCSSQDANMPMANCEHLSISEILNKYRMQICVRPKTNAGPTDTRGAKLLDTALFSKLPSSMRPNPVLLNEEQLRQLPDRPTTERYIFILFYYLLTQGRIPNERDVMPAFLRPLLQVDKRPIEICRALASFSLSQVAHPWIRDLSTILDTKVINFMTPHVFGYKTMIPFTRYKIIKLVPIHVLEAAMAVRKFCERGPVWDSHPLSMTHNFYQVVGGNFHQNLVNLIYEVYTPPQIVDMMKQQLIPPTALPSSEFKQFLSWNDQVFEKFTDFIFVKRMIAIP